ncbi:hypothetical protein L599_005100000180 [Luteimonas sp. J16]|nr:hypothetical protein L599_005100000180 [Luteimonas sp. J16]
MPRPWCPGATETGPMPCQPAAPPLISTGDAPACPTTTPSSVATSETDRQPASRSARTMNCSVPLE